MKILIATIKKCHIEKAKSLDYTYKELQIITKKDYLLETLVNFRPDYVFFIHWSWFIPKEVYENFNCILFHCTDLPYGRGGSPIQNQILDNISHTKISAIKIIKDYDSGPIYLKENLCLNGTCDEILIRISNIIFNKMIPKIINEQLKPIDQIGEVTSYTRNYNNRIEKEFNLNKIFDFIRMLDGEGYSKAYIEFGEYKIEFSRASLKNDHIIADVKIERTIKNEK